MLKRNIVKYFVCSICIILLIFAPLGCSKLDRQNMHQENNPQETSGAETAQQPEGRTDSGLPELIFPSRPVSQVIDVPFVPQKFEAKAEPYTINEDLSNIVNLERFGSFTPRQKQLLSQNGFFVNPTKQEQLFYIYEDNEYKKLPSFVTVDSVLLVYHVFYDYTLRTLEHEKLMGILQELTESMLKKSILLYNEMNDEEMKKAALKNTAYFAVAQLALERDLPANIPPQAQEMARKEYRLISQQHGFDQSVIFPFQLDYSQYKPRGHYTRNEDFKRYFRAMMWYGQAPFPLYIYKDGKKERAVEETLQALLITYSLFLKNEGTPDAVRWENIYDPTVFYVGNTDDLNVHDYKELLLKVYREKAGPDDLNDKGKLDEFYMEADKLPEPAIKPKYTSVTTPAGKQFRFMGQRYIPDSEIIQELTEPLVRPIPSGLDVMAVLGSRRAYDLLINHYHEDEKWKGYPEAFKKMQKKFNGLSEEKWRSNMYYGWLWVLKGLLKPFGEGYPSFMTNTAWEDKSLSTALASWAQLRHDTILYGKQSGVECGGGEEPPQVKGYVEPNVEVYEKLLWLTKYSRENLKHRGLLTGSLESKMQRFEDLLQFLIKCSIKELRNEELSADEYYQLLTYGGLLEYLTSSFAGDGVRWFEITSDTDKNMAVIADIHTIAPNPMSAGGYFEVGVGHAYEIYVVVPIGGKLYLTRGAVFSYYEFDSTERFTDEEWQQMLKQNRQPSRPDWMKSFIEGGKEQVPTPSNPYSTGC